MSSRNGEEAGVSWKIRYSSAMAAVVLRVAGEIRNDDARAQAAQLVELLNQHQTRKVLLDCSEAVSEMTLPELYWLADAAPALRIPWDIRAAVVAPRTRYRMESYRFFELVFRNAGYKVKLFDDRAAAEDWLAAPRPVREHSLQSVPA